MIVSSCAAVPLGAPTVSLILVGTGESLMRMEKRLSCAATGLGIQLQVEICRDTEAMGIVFAKTPAVLHDGKVVFSGLPRTEEIEAWLLIKFHKDT